MGVVAEEAGHFEKIDCSFQFHPLNVENTVGLMGPTQETHS